MNSKLELLHNRWLALQVRPGWEFRSTYGLQQRGYSHFLPVYQEVRRWSDRSKVVQVPLFPGYIFVRFDSGNQMSILSVPGVHRFVGVKNAPVPIDDSEIDSLQITMKSGATCGPFAYLETGQEMEIRQGPLAGLRGSFVRFKNKMRFIISVKLLMKSVFVEVDCLDVAAVSPAHFTRVASQHKVERVIRTAV